MQNETLESNTYYSANPNMHELIASYRRDIFGNTEFATRSLESVNQRNMEWPGKTPDMRKNYPGAKPYIGASDLEVPVIESKVTALVALTMNAIRGSQITAIPVGHQNLETAQKASVFARYMLESWIPRSMDEIELALQNFFTKGIGMLEVGWEKRTRTSKEILTIDDLIELAAENEEVEALVEAIQDFEREEEATQMLQAEFEINKSEARRAVANLRESGIAEIPTMKQDIDRPVLTSLDPVSEGIYPSYTMHPQNAPRRFVRYFMTAQDLLRHVKDSDWNKDLVDIIIENHMGITTEEIDTPFGGSPFRLNSRRTGYEEDPHDLVEIVSAQRRLVDPKNGSVGVYETFFCPKLDADLGPLKHELLTDYDEFLTSVGLMTTQNKRMYDVRSIPYLLRGNQKIQKNLRDSGIDHISMKISPPRVQPSGRPPASWGAGAVYSERANERGINRLIEVPGNIREGVETERYLMEEADFNCGLNMESPISIAVQQYYVDRALSFVADALRLCYKRYLREHSDPSLFFRVTGDPDPIEMVRGPMEEEMAFRLIFDVRTTDLSYIDKVINRLLQAKQGDTTGRLDPNAITDVIVSLSVPQYAPRLLRSTDDAQAEILKKVADDLALIWSGQEVGAQPNASSIALPYLEQYAQKQSVIQRIQSDPEFAEAFEKYVGQYEQEQVQNQNAEIGRLGTEAAELQGVNTL